MNVVLISTYDLGRQPFGLSSPAAWIAGSGHNVLCLDLAVQQLDRAAITGADLIAFHIPMHTATRIAVNLLARVQQINPKAHLCFYGLYAPLNEEYLRLLGVDTILGGEFEEALAELVRHLSAGGSDLPANNDASLLSLPINSLPEISLPIVSLTRQKFQVPDRSSLPPLARYAFVQQGPDRRRVVGYTEATRGCKHLCRHCPIVPVYNGQFRVIQQEVVLADVRAQIEVGAQHITFGDPDFFNGPGHGIAIVEALHQEFPHVTYDVTIKVEHLLKHARYLPTLKQTGCLFITSAVESIDPRILDILQKGHSRSDFVEVVALCRQYELVLNPTFVTFTPWTTLQGYVELLSQIIELDLIDHIAPIQYAIRLLIPAQSRLLELDEVQELVQEFDQGLLCYPWAHPDQRVDQLFDAVTETVKRGQQDNQSRQEIFEQIWRLACNMCSPATQKQWEFTSVQGARQKVIPYLSEPWYC